jgi:hypothetical protein
LKSTYVSNYLISCLETPDQKALFRLPSYFQNIKGGLWDHLFACVFAYPPPHFLKAVSHPVHITPGHNAGKTPPIVGCIVFCAVSYQRTAGN